MTAVLDRPRPIAVFENVDRARFLDEIRPLGEPAVLRGSAGNWPAVAAARHSDRAILDYLRGFATAAPIDLVIGPPEIEGRLSYNATLTGLNFFRAKASIGSFLDRLLRDRDLKSPQAMAMQSAPIPTLFPGFERENSLDLPLAPVPPRIWLGNALRVAIHADPTENIAVNVAGRRRFTLFPPEAMKHLYIGPIEFTPAGPLTSLVHLTAPDLDRFPLFEKAMKLAQEAELHPGDVIYIPFHWWHHVESLTPVSMLVNYWWTVPAPSLIASPLEVTLLAMIAMRQLPEDQQRAFAAMLRHFVLGEAGDPARHIPPPARGILGAVTPERVANVRHTLLKTLAGK